MFLKSSFVLRNKIALNAPLALIGLSKGPYQVIRGDSRVSQLTRPRAGGLLSSQVRVCAPPRVYRSRPLFTRIAITSPRGNCTCHNEIKDKTGRSASRDLVERGREIGLDRCD